MVRSLRWVLRPVVRTIAVVIGTGLGAAVASSSEPGLKLERLAIACRLPFAEPGSAAVDLRFADSGRLLILQVEDGVTEFEIAGRDLRRVRRVLPGRHQSHDIHPQTSLASRGRVVAASGVGGQFVWREVDGPEDGSEPRVFTIASATAVSDFDVAGGAVVLVGDSELGDRAGEPFVWRGTLASELRDLEPARGFAPVAGHRRMVERARSMTLRGGSLRILPSGDSLVFLGDDDPVRRVSHSGEERASWDLGRLGFSRAAPERATDAIEFERRLRRWLEAGSTVDDLLTVGNTPAAILRETNGGAVQWLLALLEPDGVRAYRLPIPHAAWDARVRADGDAEGRIALLVVPRARSSKPMRGQELLIGRLR